MDKTPPNIEKIVAVDFDKTICDSSYPAIGSLKPGACEALAKIRSLGYWIIIWSCRTCKFFPEVFASDGETLDMNRGVVRDMIGFLDDNHVPYDEIDDGTKGKPYAAFYIDDKAIRFENNWDAVANQIASIESGKVAFEGGATRSSMEVRFDLVPRAAVEGLARRLTLGATKHGENNWRSGGKEFRKATISHLMGHLLDYMENGNANDANTDAIICNAAFLCHFEKIDPYRPKE